MGTGDRRSLFHIYIDYNILLTINFNTEGYKLYHSILKLHSSSQLPDVHHVLAVHPDHEVADVSGLKSSRDDDVIPGGQLEPGEDLAVVDVGAGGAAVIIVHEVRGLQSLAWRLVASPVETETYLEHPYLWGKHPS